MLTPSPIHAVLPLLTLLVSHPAQAAEPDSFCLIDDEGDCVDLEPKYFVEEVSSPERLVQGLHTLRTACYTARVNDGHRARARALAIADGTWTGDDEASFSRDDAQGRALEDSYCGQLAEMSRLLADGWFAQAALLREGPDAVTVAADYAAEVLMDAYPGGLADRFARHPVMSQIDVVADGDIASFARCFHERRDEPECRDLHLFRLGLTASTLDEGEALTYTNALVATIYDVARGLTIASDREAFLRTLAPVVLVTCDAVKHDSRAQCVDFLHKYSSTLSQGSVSDNPLLSEICVLSQEHHRIECFTPGAADDCDTSTAAVLDSFSGSNGLLGEGSCGYAEMLTHGCIDGLDGPACRIDACQGGPEGSDGAALQQLAREALGRRGHGKLCAPSQGRPSAVIPNRVNPYLDDLLGLHGCVVRTGFDAGICTEAIGGTVPDPADIHPGLARDLALGQCTDPLSVDLDNPGKSSAPHVSLGKSNASKEEAANAAEERIHGLASALVDALQRKGVSTTAERIQELASQHKDSVSNAPITDFSTDPEAQKAIAEQCGSDQACRDELESAKGLASGDKIWFSEAAATDQATLNETATHELIHVILDALGAEDEAAEEVDHHDVMDEAGVEHCRPEDDSCVSACSGSIGAAQEAFEACFAQDLPDVSPLDPYILPDPDQAADTCRSAVEDTWFGDFDPQCATMLCPYGEAPGACNDGFGQCCCGEAPDGQVGIYFDLCQLVLDCGEGLASSDGQGGCSCQQSPVGLVTGLSTLAESFFVTRAISGHETLTTLQFETLDRLEAGLGELTR